MRQAGEQPPQAEQGAFTDATLLDLLASMTPEERLRWNDRLAATVLELRHGFAAAEPRHAPGPPGGERR